MLFGKKDKIELLKLVSFKLTQRFILVECNLKNSKETTSPSADALKTPDFTANFLPACLVLSPLQCVAVFSFVRLNLKKLRVQDRANIVRLPKFVR